MRKARKSSEIAQIYHPSSRDSTKKQEKSFVYRVFGSKNRQNRKIRFENKTKPSWDVSFDLRREGRPGGTIEKLQLYIPQELHHFDTCVLATIELINQTNRASSASLDIP